MTERARFPVYAVPIPSAYKLLETRACGDGGKAQGFLQYYDTNKRTAIEKAAITVVQMTTCRTPEMERAFIQRLRDMKFNLTIETISGVDVVFEGRGAYFLANGAVYHVAGEPQDIVRQVITGMARQVGAG
jgi:hypothetical protein